MKNDFLFEIGTEELPPKELPRLITALAEGIEKGLQEAGLAFAEIKKYATPRRLAVKILQLAAVQPNRQVEKRGPALNAAFDAEGKPSKACEGFARSCNTTVAQLEKLETPQGSWVVYRYEEQGKTVQELMPAIIQKSLTALPAAKTMHWGNHAAAFVRPVHWLVLLYGAEVIPARLFDIASGNVTYGHRFHCPQAVTITHPDAYESLLLNGKVIADFEQRKEKIRELIAAAAPADGAVLPNENLLNEVTGIIEWPVALLANFEPGFLEVPKEALISAMNGHQKCFPVVNKRQPETLLPHFITVSNIESQEPQQVITGNERVMRARLADADFFFQTDQKIPLAERCEDLKKVLFQAKLGNLGQKSQRVARLAAVIAERIGGDASIAKRAGELCKADLMSSMVGEFPELQGIMGEYYARQSGEHEQVATAVREHYLPRSTHDYLPQTPAGSAVALADRLDNLVGLFGINQPPTGDKDPFGLRRAALGIINIINQQLRLNLHELITTAVQAYQEQQIDLPNAEVVPQVKSFILERLPSLYVEHVSIIRAVLAVQNNDLTDINDRILAVEQFRQLPEAQSLIEANKRVTGILTEQKTAAVNAALFENAIEAAFYQQIQAKQQQTFEKLSGQLRYVRILETLAALKEPIDQFFDNVRINVDDECVKENRLALCLAMRNLFLQVADISLLQI